MGAAAADAGTATAAPDVGPVVFSVTFDGRDYPVDISGWPCPVLVRPLGLALQETATAGQVSTWLSLQPVLHATRDFVAHVAAMEPGRTARFSFTDLRGAHVDGFEESLVARWTVGCSIRTAAPRS